MIPCKFQRQEEYDPTDSITEHSAYSRVIHPVTKETITSYKKLMANPVTRVIWGKAIRSVNKNNSINSYVSLVFVNFLPKICATKNARVLTELFLERVKIIK